jgi:hypothetical protein
MIEHEELLRRAEEVRDEVEPMENTAYRVGGVMVDTVERVEAVRSGLAEIIQKENEKQDEKTKSLQTRIEAVEEDGFVTTSRVQDGAITNRKIADGSISEDKIADGSITESKLANGVINAAALKDGSIGSDKIAGGTIGRDKLSESVTEELDEIQSVSDNVAELQEIHFPLKGDLRVEPNAAMEAENVTFFGSYRGATIEPDRVTLTKSAGSETELLLDGAVNHASIDTHVKANKEVFLLTIEKEGHGKRTEEVTKYLILYGASAKSSVSESDLAVFERKITEQVQIECTISTEEGEYIWVLIPSDLAIESVISQGFEVVLNDFVTISSDMGVFKAYRTKNALSKNTWNLKIR